MLGHVPGIWKYSVVALIPYRRYFKAYVKTQRLAVHDPSVTRGSWVTAHVHEINIWLNNEGNHQSLGRQHRQNSFWLMPICHRILPCSMCKSKRLKCYLMHFYRPILSVHSDVLLMLYSLQLISNQYICVSPHLASGVRLELNESDSVFLVGNNPGGILG